MLVLKITYHYRAFKIRFLKCVYVLPYIIMYLHYSCIDENCYRIMANTRSHDDLSRNLNKLL